MSRSAAILVLGLILAACAPSPPVRATPEPPTSTSPPPPPTIAPTPTTDEAVREADVALSLILIVKVNGDILAEVAERAQAGRLDELQLSEALLRVAHLSDLVEQRGTSLPAPPGLRGPLDGALAAHDLMRDLLERWLDGSIAIEQLIPELDPARAAASQALLDGESAAAQVFGTPVTQVHARSEQMIAELTGSVFEAVEAMAGCGGDPAHAVGGGGRGQIAFVSTRDGNAEIYLINVDGTGATRLTDDPAGDYAPAWSPDGTRLAFYSERDGNAEIYAMNADGSGLTRLTNHAAHDYAPAWSPDSTQIAFHTHRYGENPMVAVMNADGSGVRQLTPGDLGGWSPAWSPDGRRIVFNSGRSGSRDVWMMYADGAGAVNLTTSPADDWWPDWSPAGDRIVFHSDRDGNFEIYVMSSAGGNLLRLTDHPASDYDPAWSPDATRIAFTSDRGGNTEVCIVNADGSGLVNLTRHPARDWAAAWRP